MSIWQDLQDRFDLDHGAHSQKATILGGALAAIREAFATLTKHGVHLHLEQGPPPPSQTSEWPKMYVKRSKDDKGVEHVEHLTVSSDEMAKNLTEGWEPNVADKPSDEQAKAATEKNVQTGSGPRLGIGPDGKPAMTDNRDGPDLNESGSELSEEESRRIAEEEGRGGSDEGRGGSV